MNSLSTCFCLFLIAFFVVGIHCHGRLFEPPSRASMWRRNDEAFYNQFKDCIEPDYNDNQLYCGGKSVQHEVNGGRCGVCGDPFNAVVKEHQAGGRFAKGIITRQYEVDQPIRVEVDITASHKGYFEFRLCPWNEPRVPVSQECLNDNLLTFSNGDTKWYLPEINPTGRHQIYVYPPNGTVCSQCLLQWRYRTGNSWGCEGENCGLGFGPQEEFYGCADIAIGTSDRQLTTCGGNVGPSSVVPTTTSTTARSTTTTSSTKTLTPSSVSSSNGDLCKDESKDGKMFCIGCTRYYQCVHNRAAYFYCPMGTVCSSNGSHICDFSYNAKNPFC